MLKLRPLLLLLAIAVGNAQQTDNGAKALLDHVGHTKEAADLRHKALLRKKKGLVGKERDLASVLFPGVTPESFKDDERLWPITDVVNSKKTQVPFEYYEMPGCDMPTGNSWRKSLHQRKNLGNRLQGSELKPAPYPLRVNRDLACKPICLVKIGPHKVRWLRKLIEQQYRIQMSLDALPVLMRSQHLNYAVRGYPLGFVAPPTYTGRTTDEFFLYNHLKLTITYQEDPAEFDGMRITGFDVYPVSINHKLEGVDGDVAKLGAHELKAKVTTCDADEDIDVVNDPTTYLPLHTGTSGEDLVVIYSYEVDWQKSELPWSDRWDIYLLGSPDDDIQLFAVINSLMVVLFLMGGIATILIRTLKKDLAGYNDSSSGESDDEKGWKLVHGDVFRPPSSHPMVLSVLVGTGAQIGVAFFLSMMCATLRILNPLKKGATLTAILILYVLCGSVAGYVSARIYKYCDCTDWKRNTLATAVALPGTLVVIFAFLNVFLTIAGAATAVHFIPLMALFGLWVCVCTPLVFIGSFFGYKQDKVAIPTKVNKISRQIPEQTWYTSLPYSCLLGGILPFGSVSIELFFIMSALWLHELYYFMGFLLVALFILAATCAEVSVVMTYLQLGWEDHRWWWNSFFNCASAGAYLLLYCLWFLSSQLNLVGYLPVMIYLTYMTMISICFSLFCGSVGVLTSFWFNTKIYAALKVD